MRVAEGSLAGSRQVVVAMWQSQIVYRLCVCSFVARAINSDHTGVKEGQRELGAVSPELGKTATN